MAVPSLVNATGLLDWARRVRLALNPITQGYVFPQYDADPADVEAGFTYYNTTSNTVRWFNGTTWAAL